MSTARSFSLYSFLKFGAVIPALLINLSHEVWSSLRAFGNSLVVLFELLFVALPPAELEGESLHAERLSMESIPRS